MRPLLSILTAQICLSAAFLFPQVAVTQEDATILPEVTADAGVLLTCVVTGDAETCLGQMTDDCVEQNDLGNDNLETRLCVIEESNIWRDLLSIIVVDITGKLVNIPGETGDGRPLAAFELAQEHWENHMLNHCRLRREIAADRGQRAIAENQCQRDLTAARFLDLQALKAGVADQP